MKELKEDTLEELLWGLWTTSWLGRHWDGIRLTLVTYMGKTLQNELT